MIRRLSRVADSSHSQYEPLRRPRNGRQRERGSPPEAAVAQGHVPVCVGEEMERFEVRTELLSRPAFLELLRRSAQEYGYEQRGVLRIPCPVDLFRRLLAASASSDGVVTEVEEEAEQLLRSLDDSFLSSSDDPS